MRTFQRENEDEALQKIVLDMSKVGSFKQLHCFLYLRFSKCNATTVGLKCLLLLRRRSRRCCVRIESFVSAIENAESRSLEIMKLLKEVINGKMIQVFQNEKIKQLCFAGGSPWSSRKQLTRERFFVNISKEVACGL